jgi:hypothetical protein
VEIRESPHNKTLKKISNLEILFLTKKKFIDQEKVMLKLIKAKKQIKKMQQ